MSTCKVYEKHYAVACRGCIVLFHAHKLKIQEWTWMVNSESEHDRMITPWGFYMEPLHLFYISQPFVLKSSLEKGRKLKKVFPHHVW